MISSIFILIVGVALVSGGEPEVNCVAPRSPDNGQAFLYQDGNVVKFVCEPGYTLVGKEIVRCLEGVWEEQFPICIQMSGEESIPELVTPPAPSGPPRPLFQWGDSDGEEEKEKQNATSSEDGGEETPLGDEARLRMVLYPGRRARIVTSRVRAARLQSASELEEEEKKRSGGSTTTTVHLQGPPSVIYVKRTNTPGKSSSQEKTLKEQYRAASVHLTVDNSDANDDQVQMVALPRAAVTQNDKGENYIRNMYWWAQHYYPRQASVVDYRTGDPMVVTLSDSQIAWINSLHPELRDQYLKDMYVLRSEEAVEGARAQAFLRRYDDAYNYYYNAAYLRQPIAHLKQDVTSIYDYSCNQAGSYFVTAPKLPNAHIARYDRRQNHNEPRNHYLSAVYRCNPGFSMADTRFTELYCSNRRWIGPQPVCIPH